MIQLCVLFDKNLDMFPRMNSTAG